MNRKKFKKTVAKVATKNVILKLTIKKVVLWVFEELTGIDLIEWIIEFAKDLLDDWFNR